MLDTTTTASLARIALDNVASEYPFQLAHFVRGDADLGAPRELHPAFHGSYDWHSCVHMHWTLVRCARLLAAAPVASADAAMAAALRERIAAHLAGRLTPERIAGECAYFEAPGRASFERPYGWAWLLALAAELHDAARPRRDPPTHAGRSAPAATSGPSGSGAAVRETCVAASEALAPLVGLIERRLAAFLERAGYPVRTGIHGNSAFALLLARHHARRRADPALLHAIDRAALRWYGADRRWPAQYEPGGDDFLSPGLVEAALMSQVLGGRFPHWWEEFAPAEPARWLEPAEVSDEHDPRIVHLHGLNLSRAWCWRKLLPHLDAGWRAAAGDARDRHLAASRHAALEGDYVGTHWLASFLLLALTGLEFEA